MYKSGLTIPKKQNYRGFTIVELLVVIVVIGILAAITIVSYSGISNRAKIASIQSDLKNAINILEIDKVNGGDSYPSSLSLANSGKGLSKSSDTQYSFRYSNNSYCLTASSISSPNIVYNVSSEDLSIESGKCPTLWKDISVTYSSSCGITVEKNAYCWGSNISGRLGDNTLTAQSLIPKSVYVTGLPVGDEIFNSISSRSSDSACALSSNQKSYCWGQNTYGQFGNNTTTSPSLKPMASASSYLFNSISTGWYHTCGVTNSNAGYCWGYNNNGQLGNGTRGAGADSLTPSAVNTASFDIGFRAFKYISAGHGSSCGISTNDKAYCWGYNAAGQFGIGSSNNYFESPTAVNVSSLPVADRTFISIETDSQTTCGITSINNVYCWGSGPGGGIGDNTGVSRLLPTIINTTSLPIGDDKFKNISVGADSTCAVSMNDTLYCWGYNNAAGRLGTGDTNNQLKPVAVNVSGLPTNHRKFKKISIEGDHTCAITTNDRLYCWGDNSQGQLGNNSTNQSMTPILVTSI